MVKNTLDTIQKHFPFEATKDQNRLFKELAIFLENWDEKSLFLMRGYAGTGKTTVISALLDVLTDLKKGFVLLAPTGRAAKVMTKYSGREASTIHKEIYDISGEENSRMECVVKQSLYANTLVIVDESSMISDENKKNDNSFFVSSLLDDLFEYVESGCNCKILLVGDNAQLPPVGLPHSPALEVDFLQKRFFGKIYFCEMKDIVRQSQDSGILYNATRLRVKLAADDFALPYFDIENQPDITTVSGVDLQYLLEENYSRNNDEKAVVVTYSNKRANLYNKEIRRRILDRESEICVGDKMMVLKNNYFWSKKSSKLSFIANGDTIEIERIHQIEEKYGFRFAHIEMNLIDYPDMPNIDVILLLDTINIEQAALSYEDNKRLWDAIWAEYGDKPPRYKYMAMRGNKYMNALQVKFAYALTGHKTQGGQWETVFIDQSFTRNGYQNSDYVRWLYTAITRAAKKVYLVGFDKTFFE
ncbi:ATP-dependent exodeoxyribonuclease [Bacteroidia bacterium]|nr:ATP-dependent exodeoxyribonuclease [Bacteroidia bacterium]